MFRTLMMLLAALLIAMCFVQFVWAFTWAAYQFSYVLLIGFLIFAILWLVIPMPRERG